MTAMQRNIAISALILALFTALGVGLVAGIQQVTAKRIAANQRAALLRSLNTLIPAEEYDNDLVNDTIEVPANELIDPDRATTLYIARRRGEPIAVVFTPVALEGYGGSIYLLVGLYMDGTLAGTRVLSHRETPGLGDPIHQDRSDWILAFAGRSLNNPHKQGWAVKRDGGQFDQFTGATISPRAVVKAVYNTLIYFEYYGRALLLTQHAKAATPESSRAPTIASDP